MYEPFDEKRPGEPKNADVDDRYRATRYQDDIATVLKNANAAKARERERAIMRQKARKKRIITRLTIVLVAFLLVVVLAISGIVAIVRGIAGLFSNDKPDIETLIQTADAYALSYDYDKAIETIASYGEKFEKKKELKQAVIKYQDGKSKLVPYADNEEITHISFRSLIYDTAKAFDGDDSAQKYERNMVTVTEFKNILGELYARGFVLVDIKDIAQNKDGKAEYKTLYLPKGKKPLVLSQENLSYYESLDGNGFAKRLVIGEDGMPLNEYIDDSGATVLGAYDVVPILEAFIAEHPGFSYRGARATLAVTGYDGVLGYRTNPNNDAYSDSEKEQAKKVATRLKELGYTFACNSWDYVNYNNLSLAELRKDIEHWEVEVEPLVGSTNILIYPGGYDIATGEYKDDNAKYQYLKEKGFFIFCPTDSEPYSVTLGETYLKQGRRVIEGRNLYYNADKLSDLFVAEEMLDIARKTEESAE